MWIVYLFLIYMLLLLYYLKNKNKKYILIYLVPMFLTLAFQDGIGTDYELYSSWLKFPTAFSSKKGWLFKKMLELLNNFGNDRILFITVAMIQVVLLYLILKQLLKLNIINNIYIYFVILLISTPVYYQMFNTLRSSIASLLFTLAIFNNRKIRIIIYFIIGFLIHPTIVILLPIIYLKNFLNRYISKGIWICYLMGSFVFMKTKIIYILANFIYNINIDFKYKNYLVSNHMYQYIEGFGIAIFIKFLLSLFFIIYIYKREKYGYIINLGLLTMGFTMIFYYTPVLNRMLEYMNIFLGIVNYKLILKTSKKRYCYLGVVVFVFYILCYIRQSFFML